MVCDRNSQLLPNLQGLVTRSAGRCPGVRESAGNLSDAPNAETNLPRIAQVVSDNWKERLEGVEALATLVAELGDGARSPHDDTLVCFVAPTVVKEKNLQVQARHV